MVLERLADATIYTDTSAASSRRFGGCSALDHSRISGAEQLDDGIGAHGLLVCFTEQHRQRSRVVLCEIVIPRLASPSGVP
jgi:hypothetical protein